MKKILACLVGFSLMLSGCGTSIKTDHITYETYGLLNSEKFKHDDMCYSASVGSVILGVLLIETVVAPIYIFGFDVMEPTHIKVNGSCDLK